MEVLLKFTHGVVEHPLKLLTEINDHLTNLVKQLVDDVVHFFQSVRLFFLPINFFVQNLSEFGSLLGAVVMLLKVKLHRCSTTQITKAFFVMHRSTLLKGEFLAGGSP